MVPGGAVVPGGRFFLDRITGLQDGHHGGNVIVPGLAIQLVAKFRFPELCC
jgi:hypothetical protein